MQPSARLALGALVLGGADIIILAIGPSLRRKSTAPLDLHRLEGLKALFVYTRMGWLVPAVWLAAVALSSQISPDVAAEVGVSRVAFIFLLAAALSALLLALAEAGLNREKVPVTVQRFGKEKEVLWGTHTFSMAPIGYWAVVIPGLTVALYFIFFLI